MSTATTSPARRGKAIPLANDPPKMKKAAKKAPAAPVMSVHGNRMGRPKLAKNMTMEELAHEIEETSASIALNRKSVEVATAALEKEEPRLDELSDALSERLKAMRS